MLLCVPVVLLAVATAGRAEASKLAGEIVRTSGVKGGLCVHLGVTDGRLTAALGAGGKFLVHGLAVEASAVDKARACLVARGIYGKVSVAHGSLKRLPYATDLVNLLVVEDPPKLRAKGLSQREILRVLTPGGVAWLGGKRVTKPHPTDTDEWTHWRYAPEGNMVSRDKRVGIPAHLKWIMSPTWARSHAIIGCSRAMVSSGGRLFTVYDEAPRGIRGPMRMKLVARDASNGLVLWQRPLESTTPLGLSGKDHPYYWDKQYYWYKRRTLVAVKDRVYAVLRQDGPLVALDAATGETLKTYDKVGSPREVVLAGDSLVLVLHRKDRYARYGLGSICVLDVDTGDVRWHNTTDAVRYAVVVDERVYFDAAGELVCVGLADGAETWRRKKPAGARVLCFHHDGRLFLKGRSRNLYAVSADDGRPLWRYDYVDFNGHSYSDTDVYAVGGLVWVQSGGEAWAMVGLDPATGKEKRRVDFPREYPKTRGHHRCHPNRATERYFLLDTKSIDFIDWRTRKVYDVRPYRGNCYIGMLPANGLLYVPPNACQCGEYFRGFLALSASRETPGPETAVTSAERFEKGPAWGKVPQEKTDMPRGDWPTYRGDTLRSGRAAVAVPKDLKLLWERDLGGRITSPTVANGMVFLARPDVHAVRACDAKTGAPRWSRTVGGRVDTPPTVYAGLVLFGGRDGWVTCLRATDGELVWRFRAAPEDRRITAFGQLESTWPVHGSVLVHRDIAYFAAGRSSELDGGVRVYAAEPRTGKILWQTRPPNLMDEILAGKILPSYAAIRINDVLIAEGSNVNMRVTGFNAKTGKLRERKYAWWARTGMLDGGSWVGRARWRGRGLWAELLVFDRKTTYGLVTTASGTSLITPGKGEYKLSAVGARKWSVQLPLRVRAMVLADDLLFAAGSPDVVDEKDYWAALDGRKGGVLWVISAADGGKIASVKLASAPVFDGLAAANGRLYLSARDGKLRCFGAK